MLSNAKIGDRVKSYLDGWGTIVDISTAIAHKCIIESDSGRTFCVYSDGKREPWHVNPDIIEHQPQKWEPKTKGVYLAASGEVCPVLKSYNGKNQSWIPKDEGRIFESKDQAEKAHKLIRPFQRQVNWLLEHYPDEDGQRSEEACYIVYKRGNVYSVYHERCGETVLGTIHMSESAANHLADELNAGRVEL